MSEHHRIAIPLKCNAYDLIPQPRSIFYEFIEVVDDDDDEDEDEKKQPPPSFELHQVEGTCSSSSSACDGLVSPHVNDCRG